MSLLFTKEEFIDYINFVKKQDEKQLVFIDTLEMLAPGNYCDAFIYSDYEAKFLEVLQKALHDENDEIGYKMWEFDQFNAEEKERQLKETPWLESWEALYDHLAENMQNTVL